MADRSRRRVTDEESGDEKVEVAENSPIKERSSECESEGEHVEVAKFDIKTKSVSSSTQVAVSSDKPYAHMKVENILKFLISPTNKLYVLFLDNAVKMYGGVLGGQMN
ncbi:hypothetical protein CHS0354_012493 [Potamilus streckersoni]|uniref:Uncharacterized protein n=1 Tax=Potamilus streckersoni TaxID=2493646 RepID=A0AAE0S079_9BIVA|nr:hypothetical protein CHS0354_012493 [Potamilus streckersoni]